MSSQGTQANQIREDPFYYGWREVPHRLPDGSLRFEREPLSAEDILDPRPGDVMIQGTLHWDCAKDLHNRFEVYFLDDPTTAVFADLKMCWGIPGLKEPAPDLAIVPGVRDKHANRSSFDVPAEGTKPCLILEVMSPRYEEGDDTEKVKIYQRAGIPEYLIVKPYNDRSERSFSVTGYRLVAGVYRPWAPDPDGYFCSQTVGVRVRALPDGSDIEVLDAKTGHPLHDLQQTELERRRQAARAQAEAARAQEAESEVLRLRACLRDHGIDPDKIPRR